MKIAINNGILIDPKNKIFKKMNLLIENGKIKELSDKRLSGDEELDCGNLYISPGFIDMHMHEDPMINGEIKINIFEKMLKMGVTTAIGGNCGIGSNNIKKYLDIIEKGNPVNFGTFLPHSVLREYIKANDRYENLESQDIEKMYQYGKNLIRENDLFGISFGIEYIPGIDFNELITLAGLGKNRIISAHLRNDGDDVLEALDEFLEIGNFIKAHLQISHIGSMAGYGQMNKFLSAVEEKRKKGIDVSCDCYPYTAFSTHIGSAVFDNDYIKRHKVEYNCLEIMEGKYKGQRCTETLFHILRKEFPNTLITGHMMLEKDIETALKNPSTIIVSDGILGESGNGHPRASGTFPRFISKYVRDKKLMSLYEGIEKITSQPAKILKLNKGSLEIGADADITIFSLEEIADKATFVDSSLPPSGIKYVLVDGKIALKDGEITNLKLGKTVKYPKI